MSVNRTSSLPAAVRGTDTRNHSPVRSVPITKLLSDTLPTIRCVSWSSAAHPHAAHQLSMRGVRHGVRVSERRERLARQSRTMTKVQARRGDGAVEHIDASCLFTFDHLRVIDF